MWEEGPAAHSDTEEELCPECLASLGEAIMTMLDMSVRDPTQSAVLLLSIGAAFLTDMSKDKADFDKRTAAMAARFNDPMGATWRVRREGADQREVETEVATAERARRIKH